MNAAGRAAWALARLIGGYRATGRPMAWLLAVLLWSPPLWAASNWRQVEPGQLPPADQALLLLVIESDLPLGRLVLQGPRGSVRLRAAARRKLRLASSPHAGEGEHSALLLQVPPGEYGLQRMERKIGTTALPLDAAWTTRFELRAGRIGYPGDFRLAELAGRDAVRLSRENRSSRWLPLLDQAMPGLLAERPLEWVGGGVDPFPQHWQALGRPGATATVAAPQPGPCDGALDWRCEWLPALLRAPALPLASLSPDGRWLVLGQRGGRRLRLHLEHLPSGQRESVPADTGELTRIGWCGPDCLVLTHGQGPTARVSLFALDWRSDGLSMHRHSIPVPGEVLDPLPGRPGEILFGRTDDAQGDDSLEVFRLRLGADGIDRNQLRPSLRIDGEVRSEMGWLADASGNLQLAMLRDEHGHRLQSAAGLPLFNAPIDSHLDLVGFADGAALAITDHQRRARELLALPVDGAPPRLLASIESCAGCIQRPVDLVGALLDPSGRQLLGLRHHRHGLLQTQLPDGARARRLHGLLPDSEAQSFNLARIARSADGGRESWLYQSERPGEAASAAWWLQVDEQSAPRLLGRLRPALDCADPAAAQQAHCRDGGLRPLRSEALVLPGGAGGPVEAFLSLPPRVLGPERPLPLLLLIHGGPLGVTDDRHFDPLVHWLAAHEFAVLQVNYRGSAGYGRAFRDAALGEPGRGIEADLLAALDQLLASDPRIDGERVCAVGTSYGGYSALMLALLRPALIDCAVALAPVTDLPLRFHSADWNDDPLQHAVQLRLYGDPQTDLAELQSRSPLYRAQGLRQPLLIGHGRLDRRVHPEHTERLALLLGATGHPPELVWFDNEGHGLRRLDNEVRWYLQLIEFLGRNLLDGGSQSSSTAVTAADAGGRAQE